MAEIRSYVEILRQAADPHEAEPGSQRSLGAPCSILIGSSSSWPYSAPAAKPATSAVLRAGILIARQVIAVARSRRSAPSYERDRAVPAHPPAPAGAVPGRSGRVQPPRGGQGRPTPRRLLRAPPHVVPDPRDLPRRPHGVPAGETRPTSRALGGQRPLAVRFGVATSTPLRIAQVGHRMSRWLSPRWLTPAWDSCPCRRGRQQYAERSTHKKKKNHVFGLTSGFLRS